MNIKILEILKDSNVTPRQLYEIDKIIIEYTQWEIQKDRETNQP